MPIAQPVFDDVEPWPEAKPAIASLGHNKPPLEELIPAEFRAKLLEDKPEFLTRLDAGIGAADRAQAVDDETLAKCGDLVNLYRAQIAHINATHKAVKDPYLQGGRLCDAEKNALIEKVETAKQQVERIGNAYVAEREAKLKAERDRIAAEERAAAQRAADAERARIEAERAAELATRKATNDAERQEAQARADAARAEADAAAENAALAAAQVTTKAEPVRSDAGASVSGKQEWTCATEDYLKAFKHVKDDPKVREAIDAAIKRLVRAGKRELVGVRIWPVSKATFR
jgi:hypothetical protein